MASDALKNATPITDPVITEYNNMSKDKMKFEKYLYKDTQESFIHLFKYTKENFSLSLDLAK